MAEEYLDMECISLYGCIRNTSTDAAFPTKYQLDASRSPWPPEILWIRAWLGKMKESKGNLINVYYFNIKNCPGGSDGKASVYNVGDPGSIPGSERLSGEGNSYPLQYSCLENSKDTGAWQATIHGVQRARHDWATNTLGSFLRELAYKLQFHVFLFHAYCLLF